MGDPFSSLSRIQYSVVSNATNTFLIQGSLCKMEVAQARASAVKVHKRKLNAYKSLSKGGSLLACNALKKIKDKKKKEADEGLQMAKTAIIRAKNKAKNVLNA